MLKNFTYLLFFFTNICAQSLELFTTSPQIEKYIKQFDQYDTSLRANKEIELSFRSEYIINCCHPILDNNGSFWAKGSNNSLYSFGIKYTLPLLHISFEPYIIKHSDVLNFKNDITSYGYLNNNTNSFTKNKIGFRNTRIVLHYKGVGLSYGKHHQWWGQEFTLQ